MMEILIISSIALGNLKNAEHVQLHTNVRNVINTTGAESMGLAQRVFMPYLQSIAQEQDIVNKALASPYTVEMQTADAERDLVYKRVHRKLELCELENTDSVAFKATPVVKKHLLGKYSNAVSSLAYQEETATITGFVQDCRTLLTSAQVKGIGIDDDLDELEAVNQKFNQMYQERVRSFPSAREALKHLVEWRTANPEDAAIVFTDMWMPEMNGEELAREIRGTPQLKTVPIVAMTADSDSAVSFDMSFFDKVLTKPMTGEKVRLALDEIPCMSTRG